MELTETGENLNPESIKQEINQKVDKVLQDEQSFNGTRYGALDLEAASFYEWEDRPVVDKNSEPLKIKGDVRIVLIATEGIGKSVQLHVTPEGGQPRERQVYILNLPEAERPKLTTYINKPVGELPGDEPAPMAPFNMKTTEVSVKTLQTFNKFLEKGK
jgi:hypothetical protein